MSSTSSEAGATAPPEEQIEAAARAGAMAQRGVTAHVNERDRRFARAALSVSASAHPADERHEAEERETLRIEDDYSHIYWRDPVEGCWVAYRRADCVGEEELPAEALAAPVEDHKSSKVTPNCMTDDQGCEVQ